MLSLLVKARDLGYPADYLVRCQHNRVLPEGGKLWERVTAGTTGNREPKPSGWAFRRSPYL